MPNLAPVSQQTLYPQKYLVRAILVASVLSGTLLVGCASSKNTASKGPEKSEQAYYDASQRSLSNGQYEEASRNLKALETFYPTSQYTEQSQLDLMYSYYRQSDYASAVATAEHFIQFYPHNTQVDYAHYLRGVSNMAMGQNAIMHFFGQKSAERDLGQARTAFDNFKTLVATYPNSKYTPDAIQRMHYIRNQMATSELGVAQFYMKREAYVAAIARATTVVQFFPSSAVVPEAMLVLVHAYDKTGNKAMADQYREVLKLNNPELLDNQGIVKRLADRKDAVKASMQSVANTFKTVEPVKADVKPQ